MAASISASLVPCLQLLNQIQGLVEQPGYRFEQDVSIDSWTDELGRLRVWAANIGAHQTGQSSLEFRLRDASHISQHITRLLKDLESVLNDVKEELKNERLDHPEAIVFSDDEEPCCEDEALRSDLQQLREEVVNIVDCLYKMSMLIRRPAHHDILRGTHRNDAAAFAPFDRDHVRNKFSNADETTIQRLGLAITQRRKYLRYRDRHRAKLGKGIEEVQRAATQTALSETVATGFQNENIDFEETSSNSGVSQTSYSPSLMCGGSITIPPLPKESTAGKPFECPYCFFLIEVNGTRSWTRHIFRDIKPYVCISSDCRTPNRLFDSRRDWFSHLTTNHDIEDLVCPLCRESLSSLKQYERHLARHLEELALFALPRSEIDDEADKDDFEDKTSAGGTEGSDEEDSSVTALNGVPSTLSRPSRRYSNDSYDSPTSRISCRPTRIEPDLSPDILILKYKGIAYPVHVPAFDISEGRLKIGEVRRMAARKTGTDDPRQIEMIYKGKTLDNDYRPCKDENLKQNSEVLLVITSEPYRDDGNESSSNQSVSALWKEEQDDAVVGFDHYTSRKAKSQSSSDEEASVIALNRIKKPAYSPYGHSLRDDRDRGSPVQDDKASIRDGSPATLGSSAYSKPRNGEDEAKNARFRVGQGKAPIIDDVFLDGKGINRDVLRRELPRYLGSDATFKPCEVDGVSGYTIRSFRPLTSDIIDDLPRLQASLQGLSQSYLDENPFICLEPNCTFRSAREYDLKRHMKNHFPPAPDEMFDCPGKRCMRVGVHGFKRKDHLNEHIANFHNGYIDGKKVVVMKKERRNK